MAQAGSVGAVTIATNMAGRGTDILLGGNPDFLARRKMRQDGLAEELIMEAIGHNEDVPDEVLAARKTYQEYFRAFKKETDAEHERVIALGGLHILGTERHESRRIDNQLRGRSGRQGDPGSSQFFISLEDEVMRLFGSERIAPMVERLGLKDDEPLEAGILTKQIENAQKRIEGRNFDIRKSVLEYDDVMNKQRELIYSQRRDILKGDNMRETVIGMMHNMIDATGRAQLHRRRQLRLERGRRGGVPGKALPEARRCAKARQGKIETMEEADGAGRASLSGCRGLLRGAREGACRAGHRHARV